MSLNGGSASPFSEGDIRGALKPWALGHAEFELLSHSENVVYKVTNDGDRFVLRIHRPGYNTFQELESEHVWLQALNHAGIHTPAQRLSNDGSHYVEINFGAGDIRAVGLMEWLDGTQLADSHGHDVYQSLGILIAKLHNQASTWVPPKNFHRRSWNADGLMGSQPLWGPFWLSEALNSEESEFLEHVRHEVHAELAKLPNTPDVYGLIHADLHPHNVLVQDGNLFAIDFDDCGFGWHYYDIAVALHQARDNERFNQLEHSLLEGYRSLRPLPDAEALLPLFYLVRSLVGLGWISARTELSTIAKIRERVPAIVAEAELFFNQAR